MPLLALLADGGPILPPRRPRHLRRRPTPGRLVRFLSRWARGTAEVTLRYPIDTVLPTNRREHPGPTTPRPDLSRPLPGDPSTVQRAAHGVGPLFHRRYWVDIADTTMTPEALIDLLLTDVNLAAPDALGRFEDVDGRGVLGLDVGDEAIVRLPGPWDAPVRVIDRTATSFRLATLRGHIEAGEITFRALRTDDGDLRFEVESWARSSSHVLHVLYDVLRLAREMQLLMWARMCRAVVDLTGGTALRGVQVVTERCPWDER